MKVVSQMSRKYAGPANHNSRSDFKVMSSNIDFTKSNLNWYWNWLTGDAEQKQNFKKVEEEYYTKNYTASLNAQNERHIKQRHPKRCKTMDQIINGKNTKPHEQILQLGCKDDHATREQLLEVLNDYVKWHTENFPQAVILDMALHMDEATPHVHIRRVFEVETEDGKKLLQGQALREMGLERPDPNLPNGQYNNELMTFTGMNRDKLQEIAIAHGLDIEITDEKCKTKHLQPEEYKLRKINEDMEKINKEIEEKTKMNKQLQSQNEKFKQDLQHSKSELEHLNDRLSVVNKDFTKAESEYQTLKNQLDATMNAVKEAERTKRLITEANKDLTEENKKLVKQVDEHREILNKAKEAVRVVENHTYGYDTEFVNAKTLPDQFIVDCKRANDVVVLQKYNHFVETTQEIDRMLRNLDIDISQSDDGYDY